MFRSKVFAVLQNVVNRNLYNVGRINTLQYKLFSTNATTEDSSAKASIEVPNVTSFKGENKDSQTESSTQVSSETSINASTGTSSADAPSSEYEPDKLYKKIEIEVRGNDPAVLQSYGEFAAMAAGHLEINIGRHVAVKRPILERLTVLKSAFVHKKHRVQYETRTYYRYLDFFNLTGSTADTFLEYIQRNLPEGVAMKVTKVELQPLPESVQPAATS